MIKKKKKIFGIQLHATRNEISGWLNDWSDQFGIEWRECPQTVNDLSTGKTKDLHGLLKKNKELRLVLLKRPVPPSLVIDLDLIDEESPIDLVVFDVGRKTSKGLCESHITGNQTKAFAPIVKYVKARTQAGVRLKGETSIDRSHRYSEESKHLSDGGLAMLDMLDGELELVDL